MYSSLSPVCLPVQFSFTCLSTCTVLFHLFVYLYSSLSSVCLPVHFSFTCLSTCTVLFHLFVYLYSSLSPVCLPILFSFTCLFTYNKPTTSLNFCCRCIFFFVCLLSVFLLSILLSAAVISFCRSCVFFSLSFLRNSIFFNSVIRCSSSSILNKDYNNINAGCGHCSR